MIINYLWHMLIIQFLKTNTNCLDKHIIPYIDN